MNIAGWDVLQIEPLLHKQSKIVLKDISPSLSDFYDPEHKGTSIGKNKDHKRIT